MTSNSASRKGGATLFFTTFTRVRRRSRRPVLMLAMRRMSSAPAVRTSARPPVVVSDCEHDADLLELVDENGRVFGFEAAPVNF
jgi:hypothetical protein